MYYKNSPEKILKKSLEQYWRHFRKNVCSSNAFEGIPGEIHSVVFNEISERLFQKSIEKIVEKFSKKMLVNLWRISFKKICEIFGRNSWPGLAILSRHHYAKKKSNTI